MTGFQNVMFYTRKCNSSFLKFDEACFSVSSDAPVSLWSQYSECEGCDYKKSADISKEPYSLLVRTIWPLKYKIEDINGVEICNSTYNTKEYGKYVVNVTNGVCSDVTVDQEPDEPVLPLLVGIVTMLAIATVWYLVKGVYKRVYQWEVWNRIYRRGDPDAELLGSPEISVSRQVTSSRLRSADVFRGITISLMVLINSGGGGYRQLEHSPWNGLTIADLVFPWFAWLMGLAMCLSLHTRLRTSMTRTRAFFQVLRRSVILICLGLVLGSRGSEMSEMRLPGILQRLGMAYFLVGAFECFAMNASTSYMPGTSLFRDLRSTWKQWMFTLSLVGLWLGLTLGLEVPGCPRGYAGPGGMHLMGTVANCTGGAAGYIDRMILGESHLYRWGPWRKLYRTTLRHDPEGLLGTLTCALVVQLGAQAARILLAYSHARARLLRWVLWGVATGLIAGGLCGFSQNSGVIPVNKQLWSLSYCLATASLAFFIQAILYLTIDTCSAWGGRPFYYAGRNALLLYIGSVLLTKHFPFEWSLEQPSHLQLLAMNTLGVLLWLTIGVALHRKGVILTI